MRHLLRRQRAELSTVSEKLKAASATPGDSAVVATAMITVETPAHRRGHTMTNAEMQSSYATKW